MVDHEETEREILKLVDQAEGHDRAMLLIIYRMHQELISNTLATRQIAKSAEEHASILQEHARDEMAIINQIRGGWRAATWSFAIITLLLGALQAMALRELNAARDQIAMNTARLYSLEAENGVQKDQLWSIRQYLRGMSGERP